MFELAAASEQEQEAIGARIAAACPKACVIYLEGDLGAGKTTLVRGFLRGLGYKGPVKSPTYTLLEPYELPQRSCYHFDLYRLADPEELEYLGVRDLLQSDAMLLVEWPDKGEGALPPADLLIRIEYRPDGRSLGLVAGSPVGQSVIDRLS